MTTKTPLSIPDIFRGVQGHCEVRFTYTFDGGVHEVIPAPTAPDDPLRFTMGKPYREALGAARKSTGEKSAVAIGAGEIKGVPAVAMVQDFAFMGGSLGMAEGEGFIAAADYELIMDTTARQTAIFYPGFYV